MGTGPLARILGRSSCLLLDFDGPVCSVFAALRAAEVTARVCRTLTDLGVQVPRPVAGSADPLLVLRHAATVGGPRLARRVERVLCAAEFEAVASARPTPYAREIILAACRSGRRVAIVSNNDAGAIWAYLADHGLTDHVQSVIGRYRDDPGLMKPHPAPVLAALAKLGAGPRSCVLVGDSVADVEAARAAGVASVGHANRPEKVHRLAGAGADAVVTDLADLLAAVVVAGPPGSGGIGTGCSPAYTGGCGSY